MVMLNMGLEGRMANSEEGEKITSITYKVKIKTQSTASRQKEQIMSIPEVRKLSNEITCLIISPLK